MSDKRLYKRIQKTYRLKIESDTGAHTAQTEDLSATGFFIKTKKIYPPGTILNISLEGQSESIEMACRVIWARKVPHNLFHMSRKCGMGVLITEFKNGEDAYQRLHQRSMAKAP